ncbi:MAG: hypothetical protein ABIK86_06415 [candidate division WOR-3 bacterium]
MFLPAGLFLLLTLSVGQADESVSIPVFSFCQQHLVGTPDTVLTRPARPTLSEPDLAMTKPHVKVHCTTRGIDSTTTVRAGVYFCQLVSGGEAISHKLVFEQEIT